MAHTRAGGRRSPPSRRGPDGVEMFPQTSLKLKLDNLPADFNVIDIHNYFSQFGDIDFLKLEGVRQAVLAYSPIPDDSTFMHQKHFLKKYGSQVSEVILRYLTNINRPTHSPLDRHILLPSHIVLKPAGIDVGVRTGATEMVILRYLQHQKSFPTSIIDLQIKQNEDLPELHIRFPAVQGPAKTIVPHKLQIRLAYVDQVQLSEKSKDEMHIAITFKHPPKYFSNPNATYGPQLAVDSWSRHNTFSRVTDIDQDMPGRSKTPLQLVRPNAVLDPGRWLTWCIKLKKNNWNHVMYRQLVELLRAYNVNTATVPLTLHTPQGRNIWREFNLAHDETGLHKNNLQALDVSAYPGLTFEVRYRLEVAISKGLLYEGDLTLPFFDRLAELGDKAFDLLENLAAADKKISNPMKLFDISELRARRRRRVPKTCVPMHSVTITPTTMYVQPVQTEVSNRVLRKWSEISDRFLRVRFTDEVYYGSLQGQTGDRDDEVYNRVKRALYNGILVAGRKYQFLACGNSQFRENGAYFFSETYDVTVNKIRQWMGYFYDIRNIPKYISRIGQCFSTTRAVNSIGSRPVITEIPDVVRNGYMFTDGVGQISGFLANMIAQELRLPTTPSLFQFRMGGCKGVLAVNPKITNGKEVRIRPSQKKFSSDFNQLEVIRVSSFAGAYLNRQIILVLVALGVPADVFISRARDQLTRIDHALVDIDRGISMLQEQTDYNQITPAIARMLFAGMRNDPFVDSMMHLWRAWTVKTLKEKANLAIRDGAFLLGCTDETATLRQDPGQLPEIFLQIPNPSFGAVKDADPYMVVEGVCLLVRNPALHPGDIRVCQAVKCPGLEHLKDVVVLPQLGERDLANMCAGGDLDGDDFLIMWDPDLIPLVYDYPPMNYEAPEPTKSKGPVTQSDMIEFFCEYMKNNSLGAIAVAHRAWADYLDAGVMHEKCLRLAQLHSEAVDYCKTGVAAQMTPDLRVQEYPHWHNNKRKHYTSKKVLGKLYDMVEMIDFKPQVHHSRYDSRILAAFDRLNKLPAEIYSKAIGLKAEYDEDIRRIMAQYGVRTEFEIWSAFVLEHNRDVKDYKFAEELGTIMTALRHGYRDFCLEALEITPTTLLADKNAKLAPFVAAIYKITADQVHDFHGPVTWERYGQESPMISFPWIFQDELLGLAAMGDDGNEELTLTEAMTKNALNAAKARKGAGAYRFSSVQPEDMAAAATDAVAKQMERMSINGEVGKVSGPSSVGSGSHSSEKSKEGNSTTSASSIEDGITGSGSGSTGKEAATPAVSEEDEDEEEEEEIFIETPSVSSVADRLAALAHDELD